MCDRRYTWTHLFAAVRPATGDGFALVLPQVSTAAMDAFLARFAATLAADEHAVVVLDRAGWHRAKRLAVPDNITLVCAATLRARAQSGGAGLVVPT